MYVSGWMLNPAYTILDVIDDTQAIHHPEPSLSQHLKAVLLILDAAQTNVIVNTRIVTELLFFLLIYNDDFVLLLVWLSLELRCLSPK